jgi:hypothetical protein
MAEKGPINLVCDSDFHINRGVLLHAENLRHGTDNFTSPPKEGMLRIFSPEKSDSFGRVRTGDLGYQRPALDHRSRYTAMVIKCAYSVKD